MTASSQSSHTSSTARSAAGQTIDNDWAVNEMRNGDVFFASPTQQLRSRGLQDAVIGYEVASATGVRDLFAKAHQEATKPLFCSAGTVRLFP